MSVVLEKVAQEVMTLPPQELHKLRALVDSLLKNQIVQQPRITEEEFERHLIEQGFLRESPPLIGFSTNESYRPIEVTGQPISEMIVEERR